MTDSSWQAASKVIEALEKHQFEAVIVGGAVRDFLLGKKANDVDVATSALPEETKAVFTKTFDVGIEHGTILVVDYKVPIEVTTFRTDGEYTDHRRPDDVIFVRSLDEDLQRRDFTINAMAIRPNGDIVDLFDGRADLEHKIIRAVGIANERFSEDALRILRGLRFSAQLDFEIEKQTKQAMYDTAAFLKEIARERMKAEFDKIFKSNRPGNAIAAINNTEIAQHLPGQFNHIDLWQRLETEGESKIGWAFWTHLTNDFSLMKEYRCSNEEKQSVNQTIACLNILQENMPTKRQLFDFEYENWRMAVNCLRALDPTTHVTLFEELVANKRALPIQDKHEIAVSGRNLMAWTGQKGGPWLKEILERIIELVINSQLENDEQQIKEWFNNDWNNKI